MLNAYPSHGGGVGKPRCSWRSRVKYCPACQAPITNLPKSQFKQRKYCSNSCAASHRQRNSQIGADIINTTHLALVSLLFDVICSKFGKPENMEEYFEYGMVAVGVMKDFRGGE